MVSSPDEVCRHDLTLVATTNILTLFLNRSISTALIVVLIGQGQPTGSDNPPTGYALM